MRKIPYVLLILLLSSKVYAGADADNLSKCLIDSTSDKDKTVLVRWVFSTIAAHPDIKDDFGIEPSKQDELNKLVATVYERLLTEDCAEPTKAVLRNEGTKAFEQSFEVLGGVAVEGLMSHESVANATKDFAKYLDEDKLNKLAN